MKTHEYRRPLSNKNAYCAANVINLCYYLICLRMTMRTADYKHITTTCRVCDMLIAVPI